ncbi:MAG: efflux RND transporter periplasmic adaptor subunit [Candidatus Gracilibacteria bacterium]|nr:efflux RND transporter periplasmic adaptor subunit [Candidatus Gracilibacteria bacterium]
MKKIISILILSSFLLVSCGKNEEIVEQQVIDKKYAKTEIVNTGSFTEELKLTGKIGASKETVISSQIGGAVKQINYKVGDKVNEGDVLAIIDDKANLLSVNLRTSTTSYNNVANVYSLTKESIEKDLASAKLSLENAKISKDNTYKTTDEQLKLAQTQLLNIDKTQSNTKDTSAISIDLAKKSLETSKLNLENFEKNYNETISSLDVKKSNLIKNIETNITTSLTSINSILIYADTILGISDENKYLNDSYEIYLGVKDSSIKTETEQNYKKTKNVYDSFNNSNGNTESVDKLDNLLNLTNYTITLYENLVKLLDNSITSSTFTDSSLSAMKTSVKRNQSLILGIKSTIVGLQNSWDDLNSTISSTKITLETNKISLNQAIKIAETTLQNTLSSVNSNLDSVSGNKTLIENQLQSTIATIKSSRDSVDNALKLAQTNYESTKAKLDASLASTKNQLDSVSGQKNQLLQQIDNTIIKAPFSGVITSKNIEIGQMVSAGTPCFSISNENSKIVKLDLNSDNIKEVKFGQKVIISKSGQEVDGNISLISSSADTTTKMYKVEISFDFSKFNNIVLGDYVDVFMKKQNSLNNNVIVIPFTSLITSSTGDFSVYLVGTGGILSTKNIKIGDSNSHEVIVTDGLKVGDKIVTEGTLNLSEGDTIQE